MDRVGRTKLLKKALVSVGACALLAGALGGRAIGYYRYNPDRLRMVPSGAAEAGWTSGPDSPLDGHRMLYAHGSQGLDLVTYRDGASAAAYNGHWLTVPDHGATSIRVGDIRNLSFDFLNPLGGGYVGAKGPQETIVLSDGDEVALAAEGCELMIKGSKTWSRADFTGFTGKGCAFYGPDGTLYASDGTHSAWALFAAAHPLLSVDSGYVEVDTNTHGVRARIDRIAMQDDMQTAIFHIRKCPTEQMC
jgi:hypothetical protein